jgi:hypothetical protein
MAWRQPAIAYAVIYPLSTGWFARELYALVDRCKPGVSGDMRINPDIAL